MSAYLANWKTTAAGVVLIVGALAEIAGVHIPGLAGTPDSLLVAGLGLIFAKDATK